MLLPALACNLDRHLLQASLPLLEQGSVAGLEWSFDALHAVAELPDWFAGLLNAYSAKGRLVGHGVFFSVCAAGWSQQQADWLERLRQLAVRYPFDHVTEHFGFMTGNDFHRGAPIPPPLTAATLRIGQDRLRRIQQATDSPVGLENLALAYVPDDVLRQGEFLDRLLEPVNGILILDLHNVYCQLHNFQVDPEHLLNAYPLHRVREIHISGGSWEEEPGAPGGRVRRDTHDEQVPVEVFQLLRLAIPRCPRLKYVVLEQLGTALRTEEAVSGFRQDFESLCNLLREFAVSNMKQATEPAFTTSTHSDLPPPITDPELLQQQMILSDMLEQAEDYVSLLSALSTSSLSQSAWQIERWQPHMLETARRIARKWR